MITEERKNKEYVLKALLITLLVGAILYPSNKLELSMMSAQFGDYAYVYMSTTPPIVNSERKLKIRLYEFKERCFGEMNIYADKGCWQYRGEITYEP